MDQEVTKRCRLSLLTRGLQRDVVYLC
jgi:hypothetical protein